MDRITLDKPKDGWANLKIDDSNFMISYVTNVPFDIIKNAKIALKEKMPYVLTFDLEMYGMLYLISDFPSTYCIHDLEDEKGYYSMDIDKIDLIENLIKSIDENIDDWAAWEKFEDQDLEIVKKNKEKLEKGISEIRKLLEKEKE